MVLPAGCSRIQAVKARIGRGRLYEKGKAKLFRHRSTWATSLNTGNARTTRPMPIHMGDAYLHDGAMSTIVTKGNVGGEGRKILGKGDWEHGDVTVIVPFWIVSGAVRHSYSGPAPPLV